MVSANPCKLIHTSMLSQTFPEYIMPRSEENLLGYSIIAEVQYSYSYISQPLCTRDTADEFHQTML